MKRRYIVVYRTPWGRVTFVTHTYLTLLSRLQVIVKEGYRIDALKFRPL